MNYSNPTMDSLEVARGGSDGGGSDERTESGAVTRPKAARLRHRLLFVGAFPPPGNAVYGGNVTDCKLLMESSFPDRIDVIPLDTTQRSVPPPGVGWRVVDAVARLGKFVRLVHNSRPDAVLLFASAGLSFIEKSMLACYARCCGIPAILAVRSGAYMGACRSSRVFRFLAGILLRVPRFIVCQGPSWQQFYAQLFDLPTVRCPVVDSWAATPELFRVGNRRRAAHRGVVRLLFVGWIERGKGVFELLESVRWMVAQGECDVSLTLAGRGSALEDAQSWVCSHGLEGHITFAGWVAGDEKISLYEGVDVFVLPSHAEGLPNAMIEAMAAGLPIVVTSVGSIPDFIVDNMNGLVVPPRNVPALTSALELLCKMPDERERLGRAGQALARERFGVERAAAALASLVDTAAREHRSSSWV